MMMTMENGLNTDNDDLKLYFDGELAVDLVIPDGITKASWNKVSEATGYKVELLSSSGKQVKSTHTTKSSYKFTGLSSATTYKVKVTAYKTIDDAKIYGDYSSVVKLKIK